MTSPFVVDNELRMNFYKHMQSRRRRRLPHVQRDTSRHPHSFWPTYRGAIAWMRKNQETFNTAIGLLDIYPSLIQDSCMDKFWEFIKPYLLSEGVSKVRQKKGQKAERVTADHERDFSDAPKERTQIPIISVTNGIDDDADDVIQDSDLNQRKTRIYLSGQGNKNRLTSPFSKLISELNFEYTVNQHVPSSHSSSKVCEALADSDIFVFLMSEESVTNPSSYRDLSAAWAMDIPTMFIKPPGFKLPSPLPDSVILYTLDNQKRSVRRKPDDSMTLSATPSNLRTGYRTSSALPRLRPSSAHEFMTEKKNPLVHRDSCDLVLMLINGYREASIWDPINQQQSFGNIQKRIEKLIVKIFRSSPTPSVDVAQSGMFLTGDNLRQPETNFLNVPNVDIHSPLNVSLDDLHLSDSEDISIQLPPINQFAVGHSLSDYEEVFSPTEKETCYVVFKDRHSPGHVIKWPPSRCEIESDDVFADSPLSFKDVDLTLELKADLDTDCDSSAEIF